VSTFPPVAAILSLAAQADKGKLASGDAVLLLADVVWQGQQIRVARNVDDVTFDAGDGNGPQVYQKFAFEISIEQNSGSQLPSIQFKASNVLGLLQNQLEQYSGIVGGTVNLYVVNTAHPAGEAEIAVSTTVMSTKVDVQNVTFTLGAPKPQLQLFPRFLYRADYCIWTYKSKQCGYTGSLATCDLSYATPNGCQVHNNATRYGSFPGIAVNGAALASQT
jgi:phage-related protein